MSLLGVIALNVLFLLAGSGILWAVRGWATDWPRSQEISLGPEANLFDGPAVGGV